jgi:septum formation protein
MAGGPVLVLASSSPRRAELLKQVGLDFEVCPPGTDESVDPGLAGEQAVVAVARRKAEAVAARRPGRPVLAADTMVRLGDLLLGKPADESEARAMLRSLSGRWHDVLTGVVLLRGDRWSGERVSLTRVRLADLTDAEVDRYVAGPEPYDKAGAYGIQERAGWFVAEIRGSAGNVAGLPLEAVRALILEAGLPLPDLGGS